MGFTTHQTLQKYLKIISQDEMLKTLQEMIDATHPKVSLDTRTVLNLTLFGNQHTLADAISPKMTKQAQLVLRSILFNPLGDAVAIQERQDKIMRLKNNIYLDVFYSSKPKKNSCTSLRHPLFRTKPSEFANTEANVTKYLDLVRKIVVEIKLWETWVASIRRGGIDIHLNFPTVPDEPAYDSEDINAPIQEELLRFNSQQTFVSRVVENGIHKHLFETDIENETQLRAMRGIRVHSKSKSANIVRFDSNNIQRARLQCSDNNARRSIRLAHCVVQWLEKFQETFSPLLFEKLAEIECYISLAYFFKHTTQTTVWPEFGDNVVAHNMELPTQMTNVQDWVKNDFNKEQQFILLKGSNGSGKTSFMRTLAINLLLAHCGLPVFAQMFQVYVLDAIFMRIGSSDCLAEGKSSFVVEMQHMKTIDSTMTANSALFIDELGCSCDSDSGKKICQHFLQKIKETGCLCVFATHFDLEAGIVKEMGIYTDGDYTYRIQDYGKNESNKNAIRVAERCGFPSSVLYFAEHLLTQ
jgi:DNA mismatch repair ATPase MutS